MPPIHAPNTPAASWPRTLTGDRLQSAAEAWVCDAAAKITGPSFGAEKPTGWALASGVRTDKLAIATVHQPRVQNFCANTGDTMLDPPSEDATTNRSTDSP